MSEHFGVMGNVTKAGWVSPSGAKSSYEMPRYDLIYAPFLRLLAGRVGYGAAKHGENNYQQGVNDPSYQRDRLNHLIEHALKLNASELTDDEFDKHIGAIAANAMMLKYLRDHSTE